MNPDTGEAETPAHPRAGTWRRDLDSALRRADAKIDREWDIDDRIATMTPAEKDALLKQALLDEKPGRQSRLSDMGNASYEAKPSHKPGSLMAKLVSGQPISSAEARRHRW